MTNVLLVGGSPEHIDNELLQELVDDAEYVCAVDSGADALFEIGHAPNLFCGDADSISQKGRATIGILAAQEYIEAEVYETAKDYTDLNLALKAITSHIADANIIACNMFGGRPDHELAALGCLAHCGMPIMIRENEFVANILHKDNQWGLLDMQGKTFSFIPLEKDSVVSLTGFDHKVCDSLSDLGISNIVSSQEATVCCHGGCILGVALDQDI